MYLYGLVGNWQTSVLIGLNGSVEWICPPRPDSPPHVGLINPAFAISPPCSDVL
jgi:hypothetical protein